MGLETSFSYPISACIPTAHGHIVSWHIIRRIAPRPDRIIKCPDFEEEGQKERATPDNHSKLWRVVNHAVHGVPALADRDNVLGAKGESHIRTARM